MNQRLPPRVPYASIENLLAEFPDTASNKYERRRTPITLPELPVPMAALVDSGGVVAEEVHDEVTQPQCGMCLQPLKKHWGVCRKEQP